MKDAILGIIPWGQFGLAVPRPEPQLHEEAKRIAVAAGCSYREAEVAYLRLGEERALELMHALSSAGLALTSAALELVDPPRQVGVDMGKLDDSIKKAISDANLKTRQSSHANRHERRAAAKRARSKP